jgi:hypothetical protein
MKKAHPTPSAFTPPENLARSNEQALQRLAPRELIVTPEDMRRHRAALDLELQTEGRRVPRPRLLNYHD